MHVIYWMPVYTWSTHTNKTGIIIIKAHVSPPLPAPQTHPHAYPQVGFIDLGSRTDGGNGIRGSLIFNSYFNLHSLISQHLFYHFLWLSFYLSYLLNMYVNYVQYDRYVCMYVRTYVCKYVM